MVAGSKIDSSTGEAPVKPSPLPPVTGRQRTIVFIKKQTSVNQELFLRGGKSRNNFSMPLLEHRTFQHNDIGNDMVLQFCKYLQPLY